MTTSAAANAIREWAIPDPDLGWRGSTEVHVHADEVADFLAERGLLSPQGQAEQEEA